MPALPIPLACAPYPREAAQTDGESVLVTSTLCRRGLSLACHTWSICSHPSCVSHQSLVMIGHLGHLGSHPTVVLGHCDRRGRGRGLTLTRGLQAGLLSAAPHGFSSCPYPPACQQHEVPQTERETDRAACPKGWLRSTERSWRCGTVHTTCIELANPQWCRSLGRRDATLNREKRHRARCARMGSPPML